MTLSTAVLYVLVFGLWALAVWWDGGIGIGARFLYGLNVTLYFLIGPLLSGVLLEGVSPRELAFRDAATRLTLLGMLAYLVGAYLVFPALLNRRRLIPSQFWATMRHPARLRDQQSAAWWLICIAGLSVPLSPFLYSIPSVRALASQVMSLFETGLVILCLHALLTRRTDQLLAVAGVLVLGGLLRAALSGFFGHTLLVGAFLLSLVTIGMRFRILGLLALSLSGIALFFPYLAWIGGRAQVRKAIHQQTALMDRVEIVLAIFTTMERPLDSGADVVNAYRSRGDFSSLLAAAIEHTPSREPFAGGASLLDSFVAVIPRVLWPAKPYSLGGSAFVSRYTGIHFDRDTSVGMNFLFEFYVNFGTAGVVIGMFLLGSFLAWLEFVYYTNAPRSLPYDWLIVSCMWSIAMFSDTVAQACMTLPATLIMCFLVGVGLRATGVINLTTWPTASVRRFASHASAPHRPLGSEAPAVGDLPADAANPPGGRRSPGA